MDSRQWRSLALLMERAVRVQTFATLLSNAASALGVHAASPAHPSSTHWPPSSLSNSPTSALQDMKLSGGLPVVVWVTLFAADCSARQQDVARVPNGANVLNVPAIGHSDNTGRSGALNQFGRDYSDAGNKWTVKLCQTDSDGDGQTNGQELGDPCCEWSIGATPRWTAVSHPSDASKTSSATLWANITCNFTSTSASPSANGRSSLVIAGAVSTALVGILGML